MSAFVKFRFFKIVCFLFLILNLSNCENQKTDSPKVKQKINKSQPAKIKNNDLSDDWSVIKNELKIGPEIIKSIKKINRESREATSSLKSQNKLNSATLKKLNQEKRRKLVKLLGVEKYKQYSLIQKRMRTQKKKG